MLSFHSAPFKVTDVTKLDKSAELSAGSTASPLTAFTNTNGENPSVTTFAATTAPLPSCDALPAATACPFTI